MNLNQLAPSFDQLQEFMVNRPGEYEAVRQSLYDFTTYAAAGQTQLSFFQTPKGQSGKTIADTNMELAGQLPAPKHFLVQSIEVYLFPADNPAILTSSDLNDTAVEPEHVNDVYTVVKSGSLNFFVGSKTYLEEAPIGRFPPKTRLETDFANALQYTQAIAADAIREITSEYGVAAGRPYFMDAAPVLLAPTQNFSVSLNWPSVVALPSGSDARIGVVMDGILYRLSQ